MTHTVNELQESLFDATSGDLSVFYKSVADKFNVSVSVVECHAISVTDNMVEAIELYPEANQDYISEARALNSFKEYLIELVGELP